MRFDYLNHACMRMSLGDVRMLVDPWLSGTAFAGGWGLAYENPEAHALARTATHLWISHWHSDHLHVPTLEILAREAPGMIVLANVSHNFSMVERLRACGFRDVRPIGERVPFALSEQVEAVRYPTAGIDNMLHLRGPGFSVLDYNDCNLPTAAARALRAKIGPVDVALTNYNHAGKLFTRAPDAEVKDAYFAALVRAVDALEPKRVIPFASSHVYRTDVSCAQNASLIDFDELEARTVHDPRFVVLRVGDTVTFDGGVTPSVTRVPPRPRAPIVLHDYGPPVAADALEATIAERCRALAEAFPVIGRLCPPLDVHVRDLDLRLRLRVGRAPERLARDAPCHVVASARALADWHGRKFGDDTFFAGAHFDVTTDDPRSIRAFALLTLLDASHLDPRSAARFLTQASGRAFLWNRREEIAFTLASGALRAGELRG